MRRRPPRPNWAPRREHPRLAPGTFEVQHPEAGMSHLPPTQGEVDAMIHAHHGDVTAQDLWPGADYASLAERKTLAWAMSRLGTRLKASLCLGAYQTETAKVLGISQPSVCHRRAQALTALRVLIANQDIDHVVEEVLGRYVAAEHPVYPVIESWASVCYGQTHPALGHRHIDQSIGNYWFHRWRRKFGNLDPQVQRLQTFWNQAPTWGNGRPGVLIGPPKTWQAWHDYDLGKASQAERDLAKENTSRLLSLLAG